MQTGLNDFDGMQFGSSLCHLPVEEKINNDDNFVYGEGHSIRETGDQMTTPCDAIMADEALSASPVTLSYNIHKGASIHNHMGDVQDNAHIRGAQFLKIEICGNAQQRSLQHGCLLSSTSSFVE